MRDVRKKEDNMLELNQTEDKKKKTKRISYGKAKQNNELYHSPFAYKINVWNTRVAS